jgi:hypothetical protein
MARKIFPYKGLVADSPEVQAENAILESFGIDGDVTMPSEVFTTGPVDQDAADLDLLARSRPLGGVSIGKELYGPRMRLLSGSTFVPRSAGNPAHW